MYLNIVLLPFLGSLFSGLCGRFLGSYGAAFITTISVGLAAIFSVCVFFEVALCGSPCYLKLLAWFNVEFFYNDWGFLFDVITVIKFVVVTSISVLVNLY